MRQEVKKHIYPNGLTLIVDEAPQLMSVAIGAWVKTGSRHENIDDWGMCHFLEHMIFKGTKKRGAMEISRAIDRVGGDFNAFTSREHTCFHFYLPSREVQLGATLLKEILYKPLFAFKEIDRERQVVIQEIALTKETPEEEAFDRFMEKCFGKHPIGRNILGSEASMNEVTRKKVFNFFHQHYRPDNMVLAVSGAISFERAKKEFSVIGNSPWPDRASNQVFKPSWGVDPPEASEPGFWWMNERTEQAHVIYGIYAPVHSQKERAVSTMVQQYLGGGMSSVLFEQIREKKGWAYTVYANAIQFLDTSLFTVYAGVKLDKVVDTLEVIRKSLQKIARSGISADDLARVKDSLIYSFQLSQESGEARMMSISSAELFFKRGMTMKEHERIIRSVTSHDIQVLVKKWLKGPKPSIFVLSEKPKKPREWSKITSYARRMTKKEIEILKPS